LLIDGSTVTASISFPATGAWTTWSEVSQSVSLAAGSHTIRLNPTTGNGLANIDYLMITGAEFIPISCQ